MNPFTKLYAALRGIREHPLNTRRKTRAMFDFCVAQIASRALPGDVCVEFPNRTRLLVPPRMKGAAHFIYPRLCEFGEMSFVIHALRDTDLFVDAGANIGAYSVLAGAVAGARVIAFEPSPSTFECLRRNILLNGLAARASVRQTAVGRAAGTVKFTEGLGTENSVVRDGATAGAVEIRVARLDDELAGEKPFILKMDVEGFETEACAGAEKTLAEPSLQAFIIEKSGGGRRYGFDEESLHQKIRSTGFRPFEYLPLERELKPLAPTADGNLIYIRDEQLVRTRLREAKPYEIDGLKF